MMATAVKTRNEEARSAGGNGALVRAQEKWHGLLRFMHEVRVEIRQVTWPTKADVISTTGVVIVTVFFFGVFFFFVDYAFSHMVQQLLIWFKA